MTVAVANGNVNTTLKINHACVQQIISTIGQVNLLYLLLIPDNFKKNPILRLRQE
jgi:hypothetical protein